MRKEKLTDEEILKLASEVNKGSIFTSMHCKNPDEIASAFPILKLIPEEYMDRIKDSDVMMLYEDIEKTMPISINNNPVFYSFKYLYKDEYSKFVENLEELFKKYYKEKDKMIKESKKKEKKEDGEN